MHSPRASRNRQVEAKSGSDIPHRVRTGNCEIPHVVIPMHQSRAAAHGVGDEPRVESGSVAEDLPDG